VRPGADSLDVARVFRFDTLPARYAPSGGGDSVRSPRSVERAAPLDTAGASFGPRARAFPRAVTLEAYDVDTAAAVDTPPAGSRGSSGRRACSAASRSRRAPRPDSVRIPISDRAFGARAGRRLRVGIRVVRPRRRSSACTRRARRGCSARSRRRSGRARRTDTRRAADGALPRHTAEPTLAAAYADRASRALAVAAPDRPRGRRLPARRTLLRFACRALRRLVSLVVRRVSSAAAPGAGADPLDSVLVRPLAVLATGVVTDLLRSPRSRRPTASRRAL
jgi:hypothetical protein